LVGDWIFIEKGLKVGERIVADGAHRVKSGDIVEEVK
jgi:multidrug efflux pump subunit AcrA (membrane-fusion protein)